MPERLDPSSAQHVLAGTPAKADGPAGGSLQGEAQGGARVTADPRGIDPGIPLFREASSDGRAGQALPGEATDAYLDDRGGRDWRFARVPFSVERPADLIGTVADLLARGYIVGWFQGGSELGPRALGQRSILGDPRDATLVTRLNEQVKHRQWFRPYAPAVLLEHAVSWFELEVPSPHMLLIGQTRRDKAAIVPAIVHVDGSARVQTVAAGTGPFRLLIERFFALTGVPLLLNTSFNDHGEPIVETPLDALQCFFATGLDFMAIGSLLLSKDGRERDLAAVAKGAGR